ncbi:FAD/NAD(P)-binding domain-containing protein [Ophiobolus disseminans]|uniref:FAD/NAD(P)-binding domain-containing protein n=1 Tax=Ophiobolus disseminans TaxID=1469910 RepID=A0A6A7A474_9PLEO|nr:FAD/NAD(P)-binding domain-containing protein [Ophiobolus disseminans]
MSQARPKNIVIVGGSLGGLFMGVALKHLRKDLNIRILERNATPLLHDQGAGVVAGPEVQQFFQKFDQTKTPLAVTSHQRLYLDMKGDVIDREDKAQQMTSWDLLYHLLRANYDGVKSEYGKMPNTAEDSQGSVSYEYGCTVAGVRAPGTLPSSALDMSNPLKLAIKHHTGHTTTADADLVIAADGPSSSIRKLYLPDIERTYAGYVAWRGTVPEDQVSEAAQDVFVEKFPFYHSEHTQILAYTIPGNHDTLVPGKRLLNWVWYINYPLDSPKHVEVMTDNKGQRHHVTLPAGGVREEVWGRLKQYAASKLPPQFAELVKKTEVPFIQAITDVISPSAVFDSGRVLLIGDALAGLRPHTAMSTSQAAMNAMKLAEAIDNIIEGQGIRVLQKWEEEVTTYAKKLQSHGVQIGIRSQFGEHPMSG